MTNVPLIPLSIPVLDASHYLSGDRSSLAPLAKELRDALENVGFYYLRGHGVHHTLIENVFEQTARFHAQSLVAKMTIKANQHNVGYMPVNGYVSRSSRISHSSKPNLVEALFVKRELLANHPDVLAGKRFRPINQWPSNLPGFRDVVLAYCDAMESLCTKMLPVYAFALGLNEDYFAKAFDDPQLTLRLSHYPPSESGEVDQYGVAPHTDSSFLTMLAQSELPGLSIRTNDETWVDAPVLGDAFLVNSGDMLRRWTNHRFLSTPHYAINRNPARDRYAIPFFFDANIDFPMACIATCCGPDNPPRYEPITYAGYMEWFSHQYDHVRERTSSGEPPNPGVPDT